MSEHDEPIEEGHYVPAVMPTDMTDLAEQLVAAAADKGVDLTGENGLLTALTKQVLQSALEVEMVHHLGYDRGDPRGRNGGNSRNGSTPKTITTDVGKVTVQVPRDRDSSYEPQIVRKHQRRLAGFDQAVVSLYAKCMTTGDIANHLSDVYDTTVSRDLVSKVTEAVLEDLRAWQSRPLDSVYPVILIDAIVLKIREGQVANRPVYVALGISVDGIRDVLGMWVGPSGGEGAKQWMNMLTELKNRGIVDACIVCCDGLKGLPTAIEATWPQATVQTCVVHLVRNSLRYASKKHWQAITKDLKRIYNSATVAAAEAEFETFAETWEHRYPAMVELWRRSWSEFTPFLDFPLEVRKLIYTTNGIESLNARFRKATRRRGHFPDEQSALKVLYLAANRQPAQSAQPDRSDPRLEVHPEHPRHDLRRAARKQLAMASYTEKLTVPDRKHVSALRSGEGVATDAGLPSARLGCVLCLPAFMAPLLGGESAECRPRWTLAEHGHDVSSVLVPIRELIAGVPSPCSDHRKNKPPTLLEQDLIDIGIVGADLVRHVRKIEFDWPTATRFEVDEERAALRAEEVAWMGFAVQQLLGSAAAVDLASHALQRA